MLRRLSAVAACVLFVTACSDSGPATTLEFHPEDGETRRYQTHANMMITVQRGSREHTETMRNMMLMNYEISDDGDVYRMHMLPEFMRMKYPQGHFSSFDEPSSSRDKEMRAMMDAGFSFVIDKATNQTLEFEVHEKPDDFERQGVNPIQQMLNDKLSRPGLVDDLRIAEGEHIIVPGDAEIPDIKVTVKAFDAETVTLTLHGESADGRARIYGYSIVERNTGWPVRQTLIAHTPLPKEVGMDGTMQVVLSLYPEDWMYGHDLAFLNERNALPLTDTDLTYVYDIPPAVSEQALLNDVGSVSSYDNRLLLSYAHPGVSFEGLGHIKVKDIKALNDADQPLDVDFHTNGAFTHVGFYSNDAESSVELYPLGWRDTYTKLQELAGFEARIEHYAAIHEVITLPIKAEGATLEREGATATLTPTDNPQIFKLRLEPTETAYFNTQVGGIEGGELDYNLDSDAPEWVNKGQSRLLEIAKVGSYSTTLTLLFPEQLPDTIELLFTEFTDEKLGEKIVRFYDEEELSQNTSMAPIETETLFLDDDNYGSHGSEDARFVTAPLTDIAPLALASNELFVTLTPEQAFLCDLSESSGAMEQGSRLDMIENKQLHNVGYYSATKMPTRAVFQLMTEDGVLVHFYGHQVTVEMHCKGSPQWQDVAIDLGEKTWLVDVVQLFGDDWQQQAEQLPMSDFLREYRFLDQRERALAVLPASNREQPESYFDATLGDYLDDEGKLRIGGRVASVERLIATGEPVSKSWQHQFSALPDFSLLEEAAQ
ncbi:hypothetical protein [Pseudidiomarina sediminum]|uniref:hypothetical protein n=1 Tax=Pseudidiomarina sediminum TaxID=431675 RepID=UPI001C9431F1|nr:hypothetical protein [Pseudidiomarina sediminum]MBY6062722.1 hypothetical protein [Pseudidiomarina sediminum]